MALDKVIDSAVLDANLTAVADAIRAKGGTSAELAFPDGFAEAIAAIEAGGGGVKTGSITPASSGKISIEHGLGKKFTLLVMYMEAEQGSEAVGYELCSVVQTKPDDTGANSPSEGAMFYKGMVLTNTLSSSATSIPSSGTGTGGQSYAAVYYDKNGDLKSYTSNRVLATNTHLGVSANEEPDSYGMFRVGRTYKWVII